MDPLTAPWLCYKFMSPRSSCGLFVAAVPAGSHCRGNLIWERTRAGHYFITCCSEFHFIEAKLTGGSHGLGQSAARRLANIYMQGVIPKVSKSQRRQIRTGLAKTGTSCQFRKTQAVCWRNVPMQRLTHRLDLTSIAQKNSLTIGKLRFWLTYVYNRPLSRS